MNVMEIESGPSPSYLVRLTLDEDLELSKIAGPGGSRAEAIKTFLDAIFEQTRGGDILEFVQDVLKYDPDDGNAEECPVCSHDPHEAILCRNCKEEL